MIRRPQSLSRASSLAVLALVAACGARTTLLDELGSTASVSSASVGSGGAASVSSTPASVTTAVTSIESSASTGGGGAPSTCTAGLPCDTGGLGVCSQGTTTCEGDLSLCTPTTSPSPEICDGLDNDCNGVIDEGVDCTKRVFITSQLYTGDLGGLAGADAKCQTLADAAGLGGTYKAWLSAGDGVNDTNARDRLDHLGAPYVLADGVTVVAKNWKALLATNNKPLLHAIDMTESLGTPPIPSWQTEAVPTIWTATQADGTLAIAASCVDGECFDCDEWSQTDTINGAAAGNAAATDAGWTYTSFTMISSIPCSNPASLACIEQ